MLLNIFFFLFVMKVYFKIYLFMEDVGEGKFSSKLHS